MTSSHDQIKKENPSPSNNAQREKLIFESAQNMSDIDEQRHKLNKQASKIRESLKESGIEVDAFQAVYQYHKKRRHEQEGYDDSFRLCEIALSKADNGELFGWQEDDKPAPKEKKAAKGAANPPKAATGKATASESKADVGQEQAKIIAAAHGAH